MPRILPDPVAPVPAQLAVDTIASNLQIFACDSRFTVAVIVAGVTDRAK